jgi:serine/threonine protein phosphatase PrpC
MGTHNGNIGVTGLEYVVCSEQNERDDNEDSFLVTFFLPRPEHPPMIVLALADGMGGLGHGEDASRETLRKFALTLFEQLVIAPSLNQQLAKPKVEADLLQHVLLDALDQVNQHILKLVEANHWEKAGSTIVAAVIADDQVVAVNVGDSPLYRFVERTGFLLRVTEDHTVAGALLRAGKITPAMARVHEGSLQLESYIGCRDLARERAAYRFQVSHNDLLLLCSDGISSSLSDDQIKEILAARGLSLESKAELLMKTALAGESTDNQTLILFRHNGHS